MKRTLIQFDEETYNKLRHRAFTENKSVSSIVREAVAKELQPGNRKKYTRVEQFSSVGAGRSKQGRLAPVSIRHDEAFVDAILSRFSKQ